MGRIRETLQRLGLTKNTAWMYATKGVRCNAICPGGTATNIGESMPQDRLDAEGAARAGAFGALIPAYLSPDDIANLALLEKRGSVAYHGKAHPDFCRFRRFSNFRASLSGIGPRRLVSPMACVCW